MALLMGVFVGCSAPGSTPGSAPPEETTIIAPTLPPDGVYLTELGFSHAPDKFSVPAAARIQSGFNNPDVINVIYTGADGPAVHGYLVQHLAEMGFVVTAQSDDSILWNSSDWDGAFTMTAQQAGLTLRSKVRGS